MCKHKKIEGAGQYQLDLVHYLKTLQKKPGALLKHSLGLKQCPRLHSIYQDNFKQKPKEFIEKLIENKNMYIDEIVNLLENGQEEEMMYYV